MTKTELYENIKELGPEMNPQERMMLYMQGKEVDCLPYSLLSHEALAYIWGFTTENLRHSFESMCALLERKRDLYGEPGISGGLGLRGLSEALGSKLKYPENSEDMVVEHILKDYDQLDALEEFEVEKNTILLNKLDLMKRLMDHFPDMPAFGGVAGPMSTAISIRRIELVLRDMVRDPEHLHRLLDFCVTCNLKWVKTLHETFGITSISIADPATTTDILGYKYYREFSYPYMKKLFDGIMEITHQVPSLHICGHSKKILPDLADIGFNNFSLDNCENLEEIKNLIGDRMLLGGNIAPVDVMMNGSIDDVIEATRQVIYYGSDSPCGYIVMPGCQLPRGTPLENIDALRYAVRKYSKGAVKGKRINSLEE